MDVFQKFLIEDDDEFGNCVIMAKCTFHKQLVTDVKKVHGGGMWKYENEGSSVVILYGSSCDYGYPDIDKLKDAIANDNVYTSKALCIKFSRRLPDVKYKYQQPNGDIVDL